MNCPVYKVAIVNDWLRDNQVLAIDWLSYSPDLNLIECLGNYETSTCFTASYVQQPRRSCSNDLEFYYIRNCIKVLRIYAWKSATGYQKQRFYNLFLTMITLVCLAFCSHSLCSIFGWNYMKKKGVENCVVELYTFSHRLSENRNSWLT